ncbi:hypothetical protein AVEN_181827-1 [Araneus ventricosus]|uniref:Uncharacterized protein n=1 Tax=Araneus ventricosus TaxID=182803 RepID=A0A4Y2EXK0_ARAVE|nr:hypothetical protein AVEN_181827-1 [Araneus ventricosus]
MNLRHYFHRGWPRAAVSIEGSRSLESDSQKICRRPAGILKLKPVDQQPPLLRGKVKVSRRGTEGRPRHLTMQSKLPGGPIPKIPRAALQNGTH